MLSRRGNTRMLFSPGTMLASRIRHGQTNRRRTSKSRRGIHLEEACELASRFRRAPCVGKNCRSFREGRGGASARRIRARRSGRLEAARWTQDEEERLVRAEYRIPHRQASVGAAAAPALRTAHRGRGGTRLAPRLAGADHAGAREQLRELGTPARGACRLPVGSHEHLERPLAVPALILVEGHVSL